MKKPLVFARRISQTLFTLLFIYVLWSTTYPLRGHIHPKLLFLVDPLLIFSTSLSERIFLSGLTAGFIMIILTLILGRFFCGWVCPLGAVIDITAKLSVLNKKVSSRMGDTLKYFKYLVLVLILIFAAAGIQIAWTMDPVVIFGRFVSLNLIPVTTLGINNLFIFAIKSLDFPVFLLNIYNNLRFSVLGVNPHMFGNSIIIFAQFALIIAITIFAKRFWCRYLCPLGAFYALISRFSFFKRMVDRNSCTLCAHCESTCRMHAIRPDMSTKKGECILCMDCKYDCPRGSTAFGFSLAEQKTNLNKQGGISRKNFLFVTLGSLLMIGSSKKNENLPKVLRPPASLPEDEFVNRCIRCGNCMKVCITGVLQPVFLESGLSGIWTPKLDPLAGYCEYNCKLCTEVCPTGAIKEVTLEVKKNHKIGTARIDKSLCIPWAEGKPCLVCEEHCPTPRKALQIVELNGVKAPEVDEYFCIGCGICENKCPVSPEKAIKVEQDYY